MKVSSKARYGIGILFELALTPGELTSARELAEKLEISLKYTEQILAMFARAGFVSSQRGAQGGYFLAREPEEITISQMLKVTEGSFAIVDCLIPGSQCSFTEECIARRVWGNIQNAIDETANNITVQDLIVEYEYNKLKGL